MECEQLDVPWCDITWDTIECQVCYTCNTLCIPKGIGFKVNGVEV
jgi:hypothetical protein